MFMLKESDGTGPGQYGQYLHGPGLLKATVKPFSTYEPALAIVDPTRTAVPIHRVLIVPHIAGSEAISEGSSGGIRKTENAS